MSHHVELAGSALAEMKNLPDEALDALVKRAADLIEEPWDAWAVYPGRKDIRETTFGDFGILRFHFDESAEVIMIYDLVWAG